MKYLLFARIDDVLFVKLHTDLPILFEHNFNGHSQLLFL